MELVIHNLCYIYNMYCFPNRDVIGASLSAQLHSHVCMKSYVSRLVTDGLLQDIDVSARQRNRRT
jgi:hypothetical protein